MSISILPNTNLSGNYSGGFYYCHPSHNILPPSNNHYHNSYHYHCECCRHEGNRERMDNIEQRLSKIEVLLERLLESKR